VRLYILRLLRLIQLGLLALRLNLNLPFFLLRKRPFFHRPGEETEFRSSSLDVLFDLFPDLLVLVIFVPDRVFLLAERVVFNWAELVFVLLVLGILIVRFSIRYKLSKL